jgi:hypothetical protein
MRAAVGLTCGIRRIGCSRWRFPAGSLLTTKYVYDGSTTRSASVNEKIMKPCNNFTELQRSGLGILVSRLQLGQVCAFRNALPESSFDDEPLLSPFQGYQLEGSCAPGVRHFAALRAPPLATFFGTLRGSIAGKSCAENKKLSVCFTGRQRPQAKLRYSCAGGAKEGSQGQAQSEERSRARRPWISDIKMPSPEKGDSTPSPDVTLVICNCPQFEEVGPRRYCAVMPAPWSGR